MSAFTAIAIVLIAGALYLAGRGVTYLIAQKVALITKPGAPGTPADAGLPYEALTIPSGTRSLQAWWLKASPSNDARKAILIYHGNNETITDWIAPLQHLWQHGISTFIFDYSGFGYSTGRATFRTAREDAIAARQLFDQKAAGLDKYLFGLSLGPAVLLEGQAQLTSGARGLILIGTFTSVRDVALTWKIVPAPVAYLAPGIYHNAELIRSVHLPLLIVHSRDDELFPPRMAQELYANANEPKRLVLLDGLKHNDMLEGRHAEYLAPVIDFVTGRHG